MASEVHLELEDLTQSKASLDSPPASQRKGLIRERWNATPEKSKFTKIWEKHSFSLVVIPVTIILFIYSIAAIAVSGFHKVQWLFYLTMFLWFCMVYMLIRDRYGKEIYKVGIKPVVVVLHKEWFWLRWVLLVIVLILLGLLFGLDTAKEKERFISVAGLILCIFICWICSKKRHKVKWRPVIWGLSLQFIFGLLILRTRPGFKAFRAVGDEIQTFLEYTDVGSKFVFGENYKVHFFAFKVLPTIVFFSAFISVCYYIGVMQIVITKISWLMQVTMGTSAVESLNAAGNIFVGQTEAPLLVRPFLKHVTMSELHAIMTGGFATIAGGVLAAFIGFGVSASHLLSASVMSAPAALAISKLLYPETEEPETLHEDDVELPRSDERNVLEAAAKGASISISLVANIAANLIAFLAFLAFFNASLSWLGSMVGHPELSFEFICSYVLRPVAFLMGVRWEDCDIVAELIGTKTFLNEFIAYSHLSVYIKNRRELLDGRTLAIRSEIIATYALCGFSNFSAIGIQLGGLGPMAPSRRGDMATVALRALFAGTMACFMTACVAGVLYDPSKYEAAALVNATTPSP